MGFMDDLFGDEGDRDRIFQDALDQYSGDMGGFINRYRALMQESFDFLGQQRDMDMDRYESMYQSSIGDYRESLSAARRDLISSFGEQRGLLEEGFDASREQLRLGVQQQRASTQASGAFTGIGNTSFGQGQLNAVDRRGSLDMGLLEERERMMTSDLIGGQAAALYNADATGAGNILNAGSQMAQGIAGMSQAYTMAQYGGLANMAGNIFAGQQSNSANQLNYSRFQAGNVGSGFNLGGVMIGAGVGALSSYMTGGMGGGGGGGDNSNRGSRGEEGSGQKAFRLR